MPKQEVPVSLLQQYVPPGTATLALQYLHHYKIELTITRSRTTLLGDYRHPTAGKTHRISVNGDLNPYAFLITLLHELAHLVTFEKFGNAVASHGKEWKRSYGQLLADLLDQQLLPDDIAMALRQILHNPGASSCADLSLMRVLKKYDAVKTGVCLVEQLASGALFRTKDGRVFCKEEKLRKRIKCREQKTGRYYVFSPVYEVEPLS